MADYFLINVLALRRPQMNPRLAAKLCTKFSTAFVSKCGLFPHFNKLFATVSNPDDAIPQLRASIRPAA